MFKFKYLLAELLLLPSLVQCSLDSGNTTSWDWSPSDRLVAALSDSSNDCFNCLLPKFTCGQFGECNKYDGQCKCPEGWGGLTA
ncbi:hypothetical protein JB92DRAFT_1989085 [Gautieria morchelliformis]|nr:hypothetical protein JB92DRAFT_1989085 [Gautieria morchelliformis]